MKSVATAHIGEKVNNNKCGVSFVHTELGTRDYRVCVF